MTNVNRELKYNRFLEIDRDFQLDLKEERCLIR